LLETLAFTRLPQEFADSVVANAQRSPTAIRKQTTGVMPDGLPM
jgi:hypothetical protein